MAGLISMTGDAVSPRLGSRRTFRLMGVALFAYARAETLLDVLQQRLLTS